MLVVLSNVPEGAPRRPCSATWCAGFPTRFDRSVARQAHGRRDRPQGNAGDPLLAVFTWRWGSRCCSAPSRPRAGRGYAKRLLSAGRNEGADRRILFAEYALLGILGSLSGMLLSFGGAWAIIALGFRAAVTPATGPSLGIAAAMLAITVTIGVLSGTRGVGGYSNGRLAERLEGNGQREAGSGGTRWTGSVGTAKRTRRESLLLSARSAKSLSVGPCSLSHPLPVTCPRSRSFYCSLAT